MSKLSTFLQITLVALGVVHLGIHRLPESLLTGLGWLVAITVVFSGAGYVREWGRRAVTRNAHD